MSMAISTSVDNLVTQPQSQDANTQTSEIPTFLQTAGKATKLFFAGLAALAAVASFCVGIAFTPFSPESGIAAFTIGTSLFGLSGILLYSELSPPAPDLSSRGITS